MKKLLLVLFVTVFAVAFTNAQSKMGASVQGLLSFPTGDFGDGAGTGFGATGTFTYSVSPMLDVTGSVGYIKWGTKESIPGYEVSFSDIPIQVGLRYAFGKGQFLPYGSAEVGLHMLSSSVKGTLFGFTVDQSDTETKFGIAPGVGFLYKFNPKTSLDVSAKYNMIFTEGSSTTHLSVSAGVAFAL
ncbi:MAG: porin family protein [Ignavibacterium sp.]|jgi:opacity protein-like surface antigen|uniref:outer membrane beta-barrel protein n=1 Tax=Ignavibacterium sp. TaxID=2651167 RepID=UPI00329718E1